MEIEGYSQKYFYGFISKYFVSNINDKVVQQNNSFC